MFSGLRAGTPLYIFDKNKPALSIGEVIGVTMPTNPLNGVFNAALGNPAMAVDIKARVDGADVSFTRMPANAVIADFGQSGVVISESREAMLSEVESYRNAAIKALQEEGRNRAIIASCDDIVLTLNPQARKDAEYSKEMADIRSQVASLSGQIEQISGMLAQFLNNKAKKKED